MCSSIKNIVRTYMTLATYCVENNKLIDKINQGENFVKILLGKLSAN